MTKGTRGRYTLEFKQEAVRLVESGQTMAAAARSLGVVEQTLGNWIKLHRAGSLKGISGKHQVTAEQMEISRLRAELARVAAMARTSMAPSAPTTRMNRPPTRTRGCTRRATARSRIWPIWDTRWWRTATA